MQLCYIPYITVRRNYIHYYYTNIYTYNILANYYCFFFLKLPTCNYATFLTLQYAAITYTTITLTFTLIIYLLITYCFFFLKLPTCNYATFLTLQYAAITYTTITLTFTLIIYLLIIIVFFS